MKITFLGTGTSQGIPVIGSTHPVCLSSDKKDKRLRVSVLVEWEGNTYVIDCGPDFRQQMLRAQCKAINGILFTHEHADHTMGLDDIRPFFFTQGPIPVYACKRVLKALKKRFNYIFNDKNKYPGTPSVIVTIIKNRPFRIKNTEVIPVKGRHGELKIFGFRFNTFAYLTDFKTINALEKEKLKNLDALVVNALRHEPHHSHFNLKEALALINEVKPKKAYLTHISYSLGFHEEVQKTLPENVYLAYDGLQLNI